MKKITHLIFDFGAVIINIDYLATISAFEDLGIENANELYSKEIQNKLFEDLETGKVEKSYFISQIQKQTKDCADLSIIKAWNKMLGNIPQNRINLLMELSRKYKLILLSNTNKIHIDEIIKSIGKRKWHEFYNLFEKIYLSHEIGMRKPNHDIFLKVLSDNNINGDNVLFIDDSPQHIKAAKELNINCYHLRDNEDIVNLFPDIIQ